MNKMKKLLSVVLAVVLAFSALSVLGSAAKANYKTVEELEALKAYSPYGQVTRLTTEARMSILADTLDNLLLGLNLNMGEVFNALGLSLTIDLSNIDRLCYTFDSIKGLLHPSGIGGSFLVGAAMALANLGILEELTFETWATGMSRDKTAHLTIVREILEVLQANAGTFGDVIESGNLDLGIIGGLIGGLDLSAVTDIIGDLPALVKGLIFGLFERWDDTIEEIQTLEAAKIGNGNVEATVNTYVKNLFTNDMSLSTVKANSSGAIKSKHSLPESGHRVIYSQETTGTNLVLVAKSYATQKYVDAQAKLGNTVKVGSYYVSAKYVLEPEVGTSDYIWHQVNLDEDGNMKTLEDGSFDYVGGETPNLKYYELDSKLLPNFKENIDLTTMSAGDLLYTFIPYLFNDMAPVVLNGSVKKILAEFFGAKFTYVGDVGSDAVNALPDSNNAIFTEEQGDYMFEWSDYAVINGNHYYRYLDQIFAGDISNKNNYFDIINWDYEITGDFIKEFIPTDDADANNRFLKNINNFLIKVATTVVKASANTTDSASDYTATWTMPAFVTGGNENLVNNLKMAAQAVIKLAPQHIFGSDYATNERCYYNLLIAEDNDTVLTGIAAQLVDIIMPSMTLPGASALKESKATVGSILAAVVREFAAYLTPEYKYDALIYADFGTTAGTDTEKTFVSGEGIDNNYWLDVILTMGINIGFEYIRAFADMGEGTAEWDAFVAYSGYGVDGKTYAAMTDAELRAHWEGMLDYVVDWALDKDYLWSWKMENLVNVNGLTINPATSEDPWVKLDQILDSILPVDEILNVEGEEGMSMTELEKLLRHDLILGLIELRWGDLFNILQFNGPNQYFRTDNVLDQLAKLLKNIVNGLFKKIGGGSFELLPSAMTDFDTLANQENLAALVEGLLKALVTAQDNGLLDTVLPIVGFFVGWKTEPQTFADPAITTSFYGGNDYALQNGVAVGGAIDSNNTIIRILNSSSGMLEKHRGGTADHAYDVIIKSVESTASLNEIKFTYDKEVSPYETVDIKVGGTYNGEEAITVTIAYDYVGKDGEAVGGTQYTAFTFLISNQVSDATIEGRFDGDDNTGNTGIDPYKRYQFTEDIYDTVVNFKPVIFATEDKTTNWGSMAAPDYDQTDSCDESTRTYFNLNERAAQYFEFYTGQAGGWPNSVNQQNPASGYLYKAKAGVSPETTFEYGVYDMGRVAIAYGSDNKQWRITYIYYNDYGIDEIYAENVNNNYHANMGVDSAIYEAYNEAWEDVVYYATYPKMTEANNHASTDYVAKIQDKIPQAIENFEAAKEAFEEALAEVGASSAGETDLPKEIIALQKEIDSDYVKDDKFEINFQDYEYYEYFNYSDIKTEAENVYRSYLAPEIMDTYYIQGSGIREAELNKVIAAEANAFIKAGIMASRMENDAEAIAASIEAREGFKMPVHTLLYLDDITARLAYYKTFLSANAEDADHMYFLEKEIAHIEAQGLTEADYEAVTWGRFAEALATAKAVAAGTDEFAEYNSRIYDVKYNLMVAYKQLLKKADSLKEAGGTALLEANILIANEIFASLAAGDGKWALKEGVDADKAFAALIQALGYYYVGEDGYTYNLFADSALEYADNDRPNKSANQAKVNAANTALVAAMDNFVALVEYTVTYTDGANGEVFADKTFDVEEGSATPTIADPTREGYKFAGWSPAVADTVTDNVTYTALWTAIYKVTYTDGANGEVFADKTFDVEDGSATPTIADPTRDGYTFTGWSPTVADTVTGDVTYTAQWEEIPAADPELILTEYGEEMGAFIDYDLCTSYYDGAVYGVDTINGEALEDYYTTEAGYITVVENENGVFSTGATIELYSDDDELIATYVFIYFGDVNGDETVDVTDAVAVELHDAWIETIEEDTAAYYSAEVNYDGSLDVTDAVAIELHDAWIEMLPDQAEIAAGIDEAY